MINGAATRSASALAELVRFFQTKGIFGGRAVSNGTLLGAAFIPSPFHGTWLADRHYTKAHLRIQVVHLSIGGLHKAGRSEKARSDNL